MDCTNLTWEVDIPLITNPNMTGAWLKAMGATYLLCLVIIGPIFIGTGEADGLPMVAGIFALIILGLTLLGLLIMLVILGNRFRARFTISAEGIIYEGIDTRAKVLARLAVVAGAVRGSAQTTGAGLTAISQEVVELKWSGTFSARYQPKRHTIILRNQWRDLMHIYCTRENYETVSQLMAERIKQQGSEKRVKEQPSPIPRALAATALVVLACLPLFALNDILKLDLFVSILIMAFALATVWMIPLFGWVVLPLEGYVLIYLVMALSELHEFTLISTYRYRKIEMLDSGEWVILIAALAGLAYLGWISWRAVRGRFVPVLMQDML